MNSREGPNPVNSQVGRVRGRVTVGTRGSTLAQWQTRHVIETLTRFVPDLEIETRIIRTEGDKDQVRSLAEFGGLGLFTKEIENALLAGEIDFAVHSLKDLPTDLAPGLKIGALTAREDPRDCLVSRHRIGLRQLPTHARVGTSSARRSAQLLMIRPDLEIVPLRGNVDTRLRKAQTDEYDAVVLAAAGVIRLGRAAEITEYLGLDTMLPDPGQGALAVEIRASDAELASLIARLDDPPTRAAVTAERALLQALGGGCRMPLGTFAEMKGDSLYLQALIASPDGLRALRGHNEGPPGQAQALGEELGHGLLAQGAGELLNQTNQTAIVSKTYELAGEVLRSLPLRGKRILVTRARDQASALVDKIRALGGEAVETPSIEVKPLADFNELDHALANITQYDWVVFTSANGVRAVARRLEDLRSNLDILASRRVAAIGPATAQTLSQLGVRVDFVPSKFLGAQIAVELPIQHGQEALLLRADIASDELSRGLAARGVAVKDVDAYRTVAPPRAPIDLTQVDAATFTSSSTVRNFVAMLDKNGRDNLAKIPVICIGPVTAETAQSLGLRVAEVAAEHTVDGLVRVLVKHYQGNNHA